MARLAADRKKFYPGMPTVTYDCPAYSTDYWRGQTWLNVAFFAVKGLENYGFTDVAGEIREFLLSMAYWTAAFRKITIPSTAAESSTIPSPGAPRS